MENNDKIINSVHDSLEEFKKYPDGVVVTNILAEQIPTTDISEDIIDTINDLIAVSKKNLIDVGNVSDGYHTFDELYEFRKMYNAVLFNEWAKGYMDLEAWKAKGNMNILNPTNIAKYGVHKSWKHSDGEWCFGEEGKWFIVSALLPTGLISNHYKAKDWGLFRVPEVEKALFEYDGHTAQDVLERLKAL